jgi:hypothetical protein
MKIPTGGRQAAEQGRKIDQALGHQMDDRAFALYLSEDAEQAGTEQFAALLLDQPGVHDDIGQPGFVFEGDENNAAGGARPLPAGDDSGGAHELAVGCVLQLAGGNEALRAEAGAQQAQRMATEGEAGAGVVGNQPAAPRRRGGARPAPVARARRSPSAAS